MKSTTLLAIGMLFLTFGTAYAVQDQCVTNPDGGVCDDPKLSRKPASLNNIPPDMQRQMFLMGMAASFVDMQKQWREKNPFLPLYPIDSGLAVDDNTIGVLESQIFDDPQLIQLIAAILNSPEGKLNMRKLGFSAIWCKGQTGHKVYPAREIKPPKKQEKPGDGSI